MASTKIEALLLDLDGTLLDIDFRSFMDEYVTTMAAKFTDVIPVDVFRQQLFESTRAMIFNAEPNRTTLEAFLADFSAHVPLPDDAMERFNDFYETEFPLLGRWGKPAPGSRQLVEAALEKELRVVVATAPFFPEVAVRERLRWAGLADASFHFITSSDKMTRSKPFPEFFLETADRIGVAPEACVMVGDEAVMDGAAAQAGMHVAIVGPDKPSFTGPWLDEKMLARAETAELPRYADLVAVHEDLTARGIL